MLFNSPRLNFKLLILLVGVFLIITSIILILDDIGVVSVRKTPWISRGVEFPCMCERKCVGNVSSPPFVTDIRNTSIGNEKLYTFGKVNPPAVLLKLRGGLGNQLFQYACHYAIARKNNWPLYTFVSSEITDSIRKFRPGSREFSLDQFNIPLFDWNTVDESWSVSKNTQEIGDSLMLSGLYLNDRVIKQFQHSNADYCQSEVFFSRYKDEIRDIFTQKVLIDSVVLKNWIEVIDSTPESVAIHIRRGDFVKQDISVPISFYKDAMKRIASMLQVPPTFFIFSDDVDFVKTELQYDGDGFLNGNEIHLISSNAEYVLNVLTLGLIPERELTSLQEFHLMTRCKHNIIPNSSFGWWAAYLNRNPKKIVIAAHQNFNLFKPNDFFNIWLYRHIYYPVGWITVDPFAQ